MSTWIWIEQSNPFSHFARCMGKKMRGMQISCVVKWTCCNLYMLNFAHDKNCMRPKLPMLQIAHAATCTFWKLHVFQITHFWIAHVANKTYDELHLLQICMLHIIKLPRCQCARLSSCQCENFQQDYAFTDPPMERCIDRWAFWAAVTAKN